ncbi:hypothetical protein N1030_04280 [Desulfovibrio mangrovi]|uniref:hypothetical protein n=1 Tax=Desulfovibrio mangrovi TaxID=2976983 RepID=UPI0022479575|nr:hypothetical protein [Desulfovibrio mangrovi]UZP68203.1 hypothetical protein N1030_04280 [Desulfovibrio mangrovi]
MKAYRVQSNHGSSHSPARCQRTTLIPLLLACLIIVLTACGAPRSDKAYSEPDQLKQAPFGRSSFVDSFLQGNWCESEALFATSQENFLRQDMVCQAAYNYTLAWRLKQYVGLDDPELKRQAERYRRMGFDCPASTAQHPLASLLTAQGGQTAEEAISSRDTNYRHLLQTNDFAALKSRLEKEKDQLYASHYARKAALQAHAAGNTEVAYMFLGIARTNDSRLGWVVFLREDWRLAHLFTEDMALKQRIEERITELEQYIIPCDSH